MQDSLQIDNPNLACRFDRLEEPKEDACDVTMPPRALLTRA